MTGFRNKTSDGETGKNDGPVRQEPAVSTSPEAQGSLSGSLAEKARKTPFFQRLSEYFSAITFAEAGEFEAAVEFLGEGAQRLLDQARRIQDAGCFSLVLECVQADTARSITADLAIPTIGIGAGPDTDGQVLVFHDLLDLFRNVDPKFVKRYADGHQMVLEALNAFDQETKSGAFPTEKESYR